ncbi:MAG: ABC transporter permease [Rhabdochlamydiaceae bacterium]
MKKKYFSSHLSFALGVPAIIWQILFFYIPILLIFLSSFVECSAEGAFESLTLKKLSIFLSPIYLKVITRSCLLALTNSFLCLMIAYPLAYFISLRCYKYKNFLLFLLIIPFWTNFLLHIYAWSFVLEKQGFLNNLLQTLGLIAEPIHFLNSFFSITLMMVYCYLPFMMLPIFSSLEKLDRRLIEASLDLGAGWFYTFRRILFPLTLSGIRSGFFLVYIPSFGEFAIPELMGGDKYMFVGSVVSHYVLGEQTGALGAAFTVVSCLFLLISVIFLYLIINKIMKKMGQCV